MARFRLLQPYLEEGVPLARIAREQGIVLRTAQRWLRRYRAQGLVGLARQPRIDRGRRAFPPDLVRLIEGLALQAPAQSIAARSRSPRSRAGRFPAMAPSTGSSVASTPGW